MSNGIDVRPRNWLTSVALVMLREENSYGHELMKRLTEFGLQEEINAGTLYKTLRRMEREGLCISEWETPAAGPARRVYSLTYAGEAYLDAWAQGCKKYQQVLDSVARAYTSSRSLRIREDEEAS